MGETPPKRKYCNHLCCSDETKKLIMEECVREFYRTNPDSEGLPVTQDFMLRRIARFYLETKEVR